MIGWHVYENEQISSLRLARPRAGTPEFGRIGQGLVARKILASDCAFAKSGDRAREKVLRVGAATFG
jgi:hypothetical protein